ncbi:MAG TPA: bifunctional phosphopantothenoylcysteine decarboxylase/phosphopantothenate--cysteine ligase CoaBC [Verrucomicrobiae bacterium]|nr:bifunctional phosphopantothenoylcysteine decarboxylase/phosphopantothenate--cysteine ligase CoaBC [Verrucomicrobiae bacterium]
MNVVVGVTGGIAAYKAGEIVRGLRKRGCVVRVAMTRAATRFVTPTTFQALSANKVLLSLFDGDEAEIRHIALARECRLLVVAPATANALAKLAAGIADDFLTTFALAVRCPILIAPAMNPRMWEHPAVKENVAKLLDRGALFIGPEDGEMAEADRGVGRLTEPASIVDRAMEILGSRRTLTGQTLLVTAGPTREPIDAVRFLSNPSSGKMGFAIAEAAVRRGAGVVLVSGPSAVADPEGVKVIRVTTAAEMRQAVVAALPHATIVVKAAAVSDFAVAAPAAGKIKKASASRTVELVPTPDILQEISALKGDRLLVGFAAETDELVANARRKLAEKNLDMIVANDVSGGAAFGADVLAVVVLDREGRETRLGPSPKADIAARLLDLIEERLAA